jgi:hypothetical protein
VAKKSRLTRDQERAIAALLVSPTLHAASEICQLHENTLRRWLKDDAFSAAYQQARDDVLAAAVQSCQEAFCEMIRAAKQDLRDKDPEIRGRAYRVLLDAFCGGTDRGVIMKRLERLENANAKPAAG